MVNGSQLGYIRHKNVFIDLMNGRIDRTEFQDLCAGSGDKTPVRGAAAGRQCGPQSRDLFYARCGRINQRAGLGQERLPADLPFNIEIAGVLADDLLTAPTDSRVTGFCGEAHIELGG